MILTISIGKKHRFCHENIYFNEEINFRIQIYESSFNFQNCFNHALKSVLIITLYYIPIINLIEYQ